MTTPDGLTKESTVLLTIISERLGTLGTSNAGYHVSGVLEDVRASLPHVEAVALARHVRETGCERLREAAIEAADWLELRPDYTEGDAATASRLRAALAPSAADTGCDGLREALEELTEWAEAVSRQYGMLRQEPPRTSTQRLKDGIAKARAALAPTVAASEACATCGHRIVEHDYPDENIACCWGDCSCPGYLAPSPATEEVE